jgi:putative toxin-antitoxin system antitoxin component (TIGR02293 family)
MDNMALTAYSLLIEPNYDDEGSMKASNTLTHPRVSLGLPAGSTAQTMRLLERGFPYQTLLRFQKASGLSLATIGRLLRIPQRTLMRRRASGRLGPDESERLLRIASVFDDATRLFAGDADAARRWLTTPSKELDNQPPLEFSRSEIGAREVQDFIGRLEHGVFT